MNEKLNAIRTIIAEMQLIQALVQQDLDKETAKRRLTPLLASAQSDLSKLASLLGVGQLTKTGDEDPTVTGVGA
jgi:hypothetical protein